MIGKVIVLGVIQGITEFLPVSSTGHLVVMERVFGFGEEELGIFFDVMIHGGTLMALIFYFRKDILKIGSDFLKGPLGKKGKLARLILLASLPAGIIGVLGERVVADYLRTNLVVGISLIFFSFIFLVGEKISRKRKEMSNLSFKEAVCIGIFQAVALIPGVSRSGITITGGLFNNLKREEAGRFAFLLSIPVVTGAVLVEGVKVGQISSRLGFFSFTGFLAAFGAGFLVIKFFMRFLRKNSLNIFIIYRIIGGLFILLFLR